MDFDHVAFSRILSSTVLDAKHDYTPVLDVSGLAASIRNFRVSYANPVHPRS